MTEADTYLGSNVDLAITLSSNCKYQEDLQTLSTHEWGHAFGLAHETSGYDEVMYPTRYWCDRRRYLAKGDYNGMLNRY